jgi:hypothetical protein
MATREFQQKSVSTHSKNDLDNCPGGHRIKVYGLSFPPERLSAAGIRNMSKEVIGVETHPGDIMPTR